MSSNAIVQYTTADVMTLSEQLFKSGYLPQSIKTVQQAFAIITIGQELGIGAWAALNGINVIQGKPTVSPQTMLALINRSGFLEDMQIEDGDDYSACTMKRKGRSPHTFTFTDADANAMGLLGKDNWRKQKPVMRRWRAVSGCARIVFPDVINGMYPPEEIAPDMEVNEDGELMAQLPPAPQTAPKVEKKADAKPVETVKEVTLDAAVWVHLGKEGKPYYRFYEPKTDADVFSFTREPFRTAGWEVDSWQYDAARDKGEGVQINLDRYPTVYIAQAKDGYWHVTSADTPEDCDEYVESKPA